jgi:hypothetical protein
MRSETVIADIPFESRVDSFPLFLLAHLDIARGARPILLGGRVRLIFMT